MRHRMIIIFVAAMILLLVGCSSGGTMNPVGVEIPEARSDQHHGTAMLGLWQFSIDANSGNVDITKLRSADLSLNVLPFMEPPALNNLTIDFDSLNIDSDNAYIGVDVIFTHPFVTPDGVFNGFDVRGVVFGPDVTNADGYTPILRPKDFAGEVFGYQDGLLGAPHEFANYTRDENPFKYFCDGIGLNEDIVSHMNNEMSLMMRGAFSEGESISRHYDLDFGLGESDFFVFNYAVAANFDWPQGDPPFVLDDFPIETANMAESFAMSSSEVDNTLYYDGIEGGGMLSLDVEVWDWQGTGSSEVTIESLEPGLLGPATVSVSAPGGTSKSGVFSFVDVPGVPLTTGELDLMVVVADNSQTYGSSWFLGLLSPGNAMYDIPVYTKWYTSVSVAEGTPMLDIIPVTGQINLSIVLSGDTRPVKDIGIDSSNGKPKIYYATDPTWSHSIHRLLPDYSAFDGSYNGQVINFSTGGPGGYMDCENGWTSETFGYLYGSYNSINAWCVMDENGMLPNYFFFWYGPVSPIHGIDSFETDNSANDNFLWIIHDAEYYNQIRLRYWTPANNYYPSQAGPYSSAIYNQPGDQGIVGADMIAADALRNSTNMVILEDTMVELWSFVDLTYGGLTIDGFVDPLDVSVDTNDYIWVLDQPNGNPRLQAFDSTNGDLIATSGEIGTDINGTALRIDLDESDDECHLLHTGGVTVFEIDYN